MKEHCLKKDNGNGKSREEDRSGHMARVSVILGQANITLTFTVSASPTLDLNSLADAHYHNNVLGH